MGIWENKLRFCKQYARCLLFETPVYQWKILHWLFNVDVGISDEVTGQII